MGKKNKKNESTEKKSILLVENDPQYPRIRQEDIIKDIEYIESFSEQSGSITASKILFPLVLVLTQDCDLNQDYSYRTPEQSENDECKREKDKDERIKTKNQDKYLMSVIVVPLYNYQHFLVGGHLSELGQTMTDYTTASVLKDNIIKNQHPRYHFCGFDDSVPIVDSVIDFKHYFTVNIKYLQFKRQTNYVCSISALYREDISSRFANYLSRIGLP